MLFIRCMGSVCCTSLPSTCACEAATLVWGPTAAGQGRGWGCMQLCALPSSDA
jgi:hypothetical protein